MHSLKHIFGIVSLFMVLLPCQHTSACNVPVYRYALQYWRQSPYLVRCFYKESLDEPDRQLLQRLGEYSLNGNSSFNFTLETVDLSMPGSEELFPFERTGDARPYLIIYFPGENPGRMAWHGRLGATLPDRIAESPLRYAIAESLSSGQTAVWLFLESGNREMDSEKLTLLKRELNRLQAELKFPDQSLTAHYSSSQSQEDQAALRIEFSSVLLSRSDPREEILLSMLINSEPDLDDYESFPMVFPIYGRGRILYALVGDGITPENIRKTAEFFIAPCTCILKETNTGTDLLMRTDWGAGSGIPDPLLSDQQSLSGLRELIPDASTIKPGETLEEPSPDGQPAFSTRNRILSRIIVSIIVISIAVVFLAFFIIHKQKVT